jgi:hypothetical protein
MSKPNFKIQTLTAFVATGEDGDEGVIAEKVNGAWMPFVAADEDRLKSLYARAKTLGQKFRIVQFSVPTDITEEVKEKYQ